MFLKRLSFLLLHFEPHIGGVADNLFKIFDQLLTSKSNVYYDTVQFNYVVSFLVFNCSDPHHTRVDVTNPIYVHESDANVQKISMLRESTG